MRSLFGTALGFTLALSVTLAGAAQEKGKAKQGEKKVVVGAKAPDFKIKGADGKEIELAKLSAKGPVLVRLTCGCSGCDRELGYFQALNKAYQGKGLTFLAVFREPQEKITKYAEEKKLKMLYAVDPKGASWKVFQTKSMPTNFLIEKGGTIVSIAKGTDPGGLIANILSEKAAKLLHTKPVDVKKKADTKRQESKKDPEK